MCKEEEHTRILQGKMLPAPQVPVDIRQGLYGVALIRLLTQDPSVPGGADYPVVSLPIVISLARELVVESVLERLARRELGHLGGRDLNRLPGLGVTTLTRGSLIDLELAEAVDADLGTLRQRGCDGLEGGVENLLHVGL